uniref:DOMON domain-containing protein n=1 Tax=Acrobeloides nanus TaxID=290746 RepID=A0A914CGQ1_9BILA
MIAASPTNNPPSPNSLYYAAVGLSLDEYMGDDTVITCFASYSNANLTSTERPGTILVSWNDHTENYILFQASQVILQVNQVGIQDSRFQCSGFWSFSGRKNIQMNPERTYDLSDPTMTWHILFARGTADVYTPSLSVFITFSFFISPNISNNCSRRNTKKSSDFMI